MATRLRRDLFSDELVEETFEPSPTGRTVIARETLPYGDATVLKRRRCRPAISDVSPHRSTALGVHPKQAARFNATLDEYGIKNARYSDKTGFLHSTEKEDRAAAFAVRGYYDPEGGNVEQRYASALGF